MVAKITFPHRVYDALNYNEKKVQKGCAECIAAVGYLREPNEMNFYQKLEVLENRNSLNDRATTKTLHVSLNFDPTERLLNDTLVQIASDYMQRIGFLGQPFLAYRHLDAGHPHIHLVSTLIRWDGTRINTHNLGRNQSEKARMELEEIYGLIRATGQKKSLASDVKPSDLSKAVYGTSQTKRSIAGIVNSVFNSYLFTSLSEYNAVLRQFNVMADPGREGGRIFRHRGLVYRILDEKGEKVGVPIKASSLTSKPTLDNLEKRFKENELKRAVHKEPLKAKIDHYLKDRPSSVQQLTSALSKNGIYTLIKRNEEGGLYGITFVDNERRIVFNGSDLGQGYSAAALQSRLADLPKEKIVQAQKPEKSTVRLLEKKEKAFEVKASKRPMGEESLLHQLLSSKASHNYVPVELLKKKRKKINTGLGL